jgi:hypothetical protein
MKLKNKKKKDYIFNAFIYEQKAGIWQNLYKSKYTLKYSLNVGK